MIETQSVLKPRSDFLFVLGQRIDLNPSIGGFDTDRFLDDQLATGSFLNTDARLRKRLIERLAATVESGELLAIDGHTTIVDLECIECGEQMFDHLEPRILVADDRSQRRFATVDRMGLATGVSRQITPDQFDTRSRRSGLDVDANVLPRPIAASTDAAGRYDRLFVARYAHASASLPCSCFILEAAKVIERSPRMLEGVRSQFLGPTYSLLKNNLANK